MTEHEQDNEHEAATVWDIILLSVTMTGFVLTIVYGLQIIAGLGG